MKNAVLRGLHSSPINFQSLAKFQFLLGTIKRKETDSNKFSYRYKITFE